MKIYLAGPSPEAINYKKVKGFPCLISYWDILAKRERDKTFRVIKNEK